MKRLIMIITLAVAFVAVAEAEDRVVRYRQLPLPARQYIEQNFSGTEVTAVVKDDDLIRPDYEVLLADGTMLEFTSSGALKKIACPTGISPELIPVSIRDYVSKHYPDAVYVEYEIGRRTYEVKLSNRLELTFNSAFHIVEIDD